MGSCKRTPSSLLTHLDPESFVPFNVIHQSPVENAAHVVAIRYGFQKLQWCNANAGIKFWHSTSQPAE